MAQTPRNMTIQGSDIIRRSIEKATAVWLQGLPVDQQEKLPLDPLQAFRLVHDDPDVVFPLYRYDMIQGANRAAKDWYHHLPAAIQQRLLQDPLEALQSIVTRLEFKQRPHAVSAWSTYTPSSQPTAANQPSTVQLQEQQAPQPRGIQASILNYKLPAPIARPAPRNAVNDPNDHPLDVTQSFKESRERETQRLLQQR